jgi:hypothetical protein
MKIGDITDDGWEVASIDIIYRKRVITIKDYISPTIGFKKGVEGWLSLSDLNDINSGVVILDNNKYSRLNFNPIYFKILDTSNIVRMSKLKKISKII